MPMRVARKVKSVVANHNFWPVMQILATVVTVVLASYIVWVTSTETSAREARQKAEDLAQVTKCFQDNENGPAAERFFSVLQTILRNQRNGAVAALITLQPDQEFRRPILKKTVKTAGQSLADIVSFQELSKSNTPTKKECRDLANKLGVDVT